MHPAVPEVPAEILAFFPESTRPLVKEYFQRYRFRFHITRPRKQKLGSFRASSGGVMPLISINNDLGPHMFLLVFLHELAHLAVWNKHGRRAAPHGTEWKSLFQELALPLFQDSRLPESFKDGLLHFFRKTPASFQRDVAFQQLIQSLDGQEPLFTLADLNLNESFRLHDGRTFVKLQKMRTRYKCYCPANRRYYLVSGCAQIIPVETKH